MISEGVCEEYEVSRDLARFPIPLGCTGSAAERIWDDVVRNFESLYPMSGVKRHLKTLGNCKKTDHDLLKAVFAILDRVTSWEE